MNASALATKSRTSAYDGQTLLARFRRRFVAFRETLASPQAWALLSTCDWYPDATGFPASHSALLSLDEREER